MIDNVCDPRSIWYSRGDVVPFSVVPGTSLKGMTIRLNLSAVTKG